MISSSKRTIRFLVGHPQVNVQAMVGAFAAHFPDKERSLRKMWHHVRQCNRCYPRYREQADAE